MKIELTDKEIKLLLSQLNELQDYRSSMTCNDPDSGEEKIFTKSERKQMKKMVDDFDDDEDGADYLSNNEYVDYMIARIEMQIKKKKKK